MKRWVALGGIFLILFALALPARAGLGDLLGGLVEDPIAELTEPLAPLVITAPLVEDLVETTYELTSPIVTTVDSVASPLVEEVDAVVEPVLDVVEPSTDPVDPVIEPVVDVVEPVLEDPLAPLPPVETTLPAPVLNSAATATPLAVVDPSFDQAPVAAPIEADNELSGRSIETASIQRALLTSISDATLSLQDREGNDPVANSTDWLSALRGWLEAGVSSLLDVLAIPARFLEILLRALMSAGSGLVAPAAILVALAVGGRRRLLPAS